MRVYLKSGRSLRISQKAANYINEMIKKGEKDLYIERNSFSKNTYLMIRIDEIAAIK